MHAIRPGDNDIDTDVAPDTTLRAAAQRMACERSGELRITKDDIRIKWRKSRRRSLVIFLIDASESMESEKRMQAAKGAVLQLLTRAYQERNCVALVAFSGEAADVVLQPTRSITMAEKKLRNLAVQPLLQTDCKKRGAL